jgi:hypothetical protein
VDEVTRTMPMALAETTQRKSEPPIGHVNKGAGTDATPYSPIAKYIGSDGNIIKVSNRMTSGFVKLVTVTGAEGTE